MTTVSWFSAGVSSAVATKLAINEIDYIIYTHIDDQHPDTLRFIQDCQQWFGKKITILQSELRNVETACLSSGGKGYINGPKGAACTYRLKRLVRMNWEKQHDKEPLTYIWGMDYKERNRCIRIEEAMPLIEHIFPLVEHKISKTQAHQILNASGIKRPVMYDLDYLNNNCVGCVKGGMGYWNKVRIDFPEIFNTRSKMERKIGASCIKGVYLDELDPNSGRNKPPIADICGIFCELSNNAHDPGSPSS